MFSITTMHSDMGEVMELQVSKMYAGNPVAALGNMIIMRSNAEKVLEDDDTATDMNIVIDVLTACIKLLSDEVTSHQSGMVEDHNLDNLDNIQSQPRQFRKGEPLVPVDITRPNLKIIDVPEGVNGLEPPCSVINEPCEHHTFKVDSNVEHCTHPANASPKNKNNCTEGWCPLCPENSSS
jgi:hypothetical protein